MVWPTSRPAKGRFGRPSPPGVANRRPRAAFPGAFGRAGRAPGPEGRPPARRGLRGPPVPPATHLFKVFQSVSNCLKDWCNNGCNRQVGVVVTCALLVGYVFLPAFS